MLKEERGDGWVIILAERALPLTVAFSG